ncbi:MAG: GxxExxY protein [Prevotella sp.]|nr:GxxExxY protein [Prevotella sp.]
MVEDKKRDEQTYAVIGAAMAVHRELGSGFLESAYGDALEIEFEDRNIPYEREKLINIFYKDRPLKTYYKADFICFGSLIVELKTVDAIADIHKAQLIHYLKATRINKGLLINFKSKSLQYERFVNDLKSV